MEAIPIITSDPALLDLVAPHLGLAEKPDLVMLPSSPKSVEYLTVEMAELVFADFSDPKIDMYGLMEAFKADPWLLHCGVIALCKDYDEATKLEKSRSANIIAVLPYNQIERHLPKVIDIVLNNRRILFQREIGADFVQNISGSFKLENDFVVASCYVNLICNFLYNANRLNTLKRVHLNLALNELLINAIEHGNCGVGYDEKTRWLESGKPMGELIARRCADPLISARRVTFEYSLGPTSSRFLIADEGEGFDWRNIRDTSKSENIFELHGRGILVSRQVTDNLRFNEKGNEVSFEITYQEDSGDMTPGLFENIDPVEVRSGDTVFSQGEPSNFLYYIAKGRYDVIVNGSTVSTLTPEDIFMGEMSFLLNNRRSATVRARTDGKLMTISKHQFVTAIKQKPHYGIFLCRLLAQRLQRSNTRRSGN
jgi:anti-sigma regulatory factor (Ser/Thr protein kinase)